MSGFQLATLGMSTLHGDNFIKPRIPMLREIRDRLLFPFARAAVNAQSTLSWWRARGKPDQVIFDRPYDGRPAMLLALYQKGRVRPDVWRMLRAARALDLHIVAVNTLRLQTDEIEALKEVVDCYIERPNFGRDFGSYRTGFLHISDRGWCADCPRLLMLNDSVYFSQTRTPAFLRDMMDSPVEVLGATENFEIEHHLGSFCIAMDGSILRNPRFQKYWREYRLTDVRPAVIRNGEMKLSRLLRRLVSSPAQFTALYSSENYVAKLAEDDHLLDFSIRHGRNGYYSATGWKRISPIGLMDYIRARHLVPLHEIAAGAGAKGGGVIVETTVQELEERAFVSGYEDMVDYIRGLLKDVSKFDPERSRSLIAAYLGEVFMEGSQIHQNAVVLLRMGLPIIKLDGMYRGMFNLADVDMLAGELAPIERSELRRALMDRPYGGDTLIGWKRAAFMRGYL
ncbi:rhamnan synthesis F family protein [Paracoccus sanguinis]|nr:rhamnan synthesis F family protein [Paracoccus sanguinis]